MRSDKYMEKIILDDLETFKRKGSLATEAVTEYVQSVESKVRQRSSYNIQNQFKELQSLLQESCQTLNRVIIGLANMVPSSDVNLSRPIEDAPRPMITSDILPPAQWSSSDCSTKIDHERNSSSPSPDIALDGKREAMVEPSSSSASSTSSTTDANFKARVRMMEILKKQRQRSKPEEDEFAMEIPEPTIKLNVDAPEFKPSALDSKSSFSQTSTSSDNETAVRTRNTLATLPQKQCDPIGDPQSGARQRIPDASGRDMEPKALKAKTSSSSMESFLTASAADYDQERDDEQTPTQEIKSVAGFEITSSNGFGAGDRKDIEGLAPNSYTGGVESRPSSISTRNVIYDTEQVLRGTAKALRDQAPNGFREEAGFRLPNRHANNDDTDQLPRETMDDSREKETPHVTQVLVDGLDRWAQQQMPVCAPQPMQTEDQQIAVELGAALKQWIPKQTQGETPPDVRCTRVPPLWNYVHVSFSDVDLKTGKVYVQMLADELVIAQLADEVNSRTWSMIPKRNIADLRGCWVIAPYHDAKYRAQVVSSESEDNIEVYFLDYGNKATVSLQDLRVMSGRKLLKTCKIAIPCVLDDALMRIPNILNDMPETAYVCLANPYESNGETVYVIMDVMPSTRENFQELPDPGMFYASQDLSVVPYTVVISHATSPESMWLVEQKDLETLKEIEGILERLPPELCTLELATKSVYVAYGGKRAMVLDRREDRYDLLLLDNGKTVKNVPLSACRRLPLLAHMQPRAAKYATLANCKVPANRPDLGEKMMAPHIGRTFDMKKKNDDTDEVILIDPETRKYLANELKAKYGL